MSMIDLSKQGELVVEGEVAETFEREAVKKIKIYIKSGHLEIPVGGELEFHLGDKVHFKSTASFSAAKVELSDFVKNHKSNKQRR